MSDTSRPLILLTNDDGVDSPGLHALARALVDLGDILISAPSRQYSASGRSMSAVGEIVLLDLNLGDERIATYAVDAAPAIAARAGVMLLARRPIALAFAGINYGENIGTSITTSGTVCAAIETASFGIPSVAISRETDPAHHFDVSDAVDFQVAACFAHRLASALLERPLPPEVDLLKVDVPQSATPDTPWELTRLTRQRYFESRVSTDPRGQRRFTGYYRHIDRAALEPDSDAHVFAVKRHISVCPLTIDLSARPAGGASRAWLELGADEAHPRVGRCPMMSSADE